MAPMECPRCVAERRGRSVRVAVRIAATIALAAFVVFALAIQIEARGPWPVDERWVYSLALLSFVFACASLEFSALVRRLALRAATPLPAPPADPITHYREGGPLECPRHPFAR